MGVPCGQTDESLVSLEERTENVIAYVDTPMAHPGIPKPTAANRSPGLSSLLLDAGGDNDPGDYHASFVQKNAGRTEDRDTEVVVVSALDGELLCTVRRPCYDSIASLRRAVASASPQVCAFDLLHNNQILADSSSLQDAGLACGSVVKLMRRNLRASDLTVSSYGEGGLGCLVVTYQPSGAELRMRGARCGDDKYNGIMSCEVYREPAWLEDEEDGVLLYYQKTIGQFSAHESLTTHVKARRLLGLRSDVVTARDSEGGMWVTFKSEKTAPYKFGSDVFSGMRLNILDASDKDWLFARSPSKRGDGWVKKKDVAGLGECTLEWAGPESVLEQSVAEQRE